MPSGRRSKETLGRACRLTRATLLPLQQVVMSSTEWAQAALQSFDAVVSATEGFRSRPGQRLMAEQVARTRWPGWAMRWGWWRG